MVYINENTTTIVLPKVAFYSVDTLIFENQVTHKQITLENVTD